MENSFRIHTEITKDAVLNVNMRQDFDFLEVLSLKLRQADAYKLHSSNYGVVVGRVLANDAFGIPNARVSVFVANEGGETSEIEKLYPYSSIRSTDSEGRRYNLLPDYSDDECYRVVGTFPNKRLVLDNNTVLEVFDKYWKYSTVTNNAGDYMIFGIPSGNQEIKVDLDLSDIGILSQKPTDFTYKGYNLSMFDSPTQFKESTNLEGLPQLFSQNKSVFVYPFWGDAENGIAAITRSDVQIQYKFEPTCVFMGSIVSDNDSNAINHKCAPDINNGMNDQLITGEGNIEMIRKTPDGLVEEFQVQTGEALIDSNGVWCYQIPMNLDYVGMDEYGNIVPTDNPSKGVPTRTQVRFRISKNETGDEGFSRHTAKYLVPMNPVFDSGKVVPTINEPGRDIEKMYNFGSNTPQSCFRDLYWNNVYSVKNYIPKFQVAHRVTSKNYSALKGANLANDQNQLPFNKLRFDLPFVYMVLCIVYSMVIVIVGIVNAIICGIDAIIKVIRDIIGVRFLGIRPFGFLLKLVPDYIGCIPLSAGLSDDNTAYYPGCVCDSTGLEKGACPQDLDNCKKSKDGSELKDKIQQSLAEEFKIVKLDLYQDWVNGVLYMPLWYWRKRKKQSFLFGLIKRKAKNQYCDCDKVFNRLKTFLTCSIEYNDNSLGTDDRNTDEDETKWHKKNKSHAVLFKHGLIKQVENKDGLNIYYYSALDATSGNDNAKLLMIDRPSDFMAVRLYATDIILLGNLNEDNLYGIPQLFKALPSTTANIPPIATISEPSETENEGEEGNTTNVDNDAAYSEDSGVTLTTGMDWGNKDAANRHSPRFSHGLFMDLACTYTRTKAKSCINVERLSELGVNYDTNYEMPFRGGGDIDSGELPADGFVSKYELDDLENRAMFATMNYIGFTPQPYQTEKGLYTTQVYDENTGYLVPKFRYLYPVDFDGRMAPIMRRYKHGFNYSQSDVPDETYMTFRLGADKNNSDNKGVRHFYINERGKFAMPLYDNSYYFYFGLNKGNTAIDKFNQKFFAECFQNNKDWFTLDIDTQGQSYCTDAYKPDLKLFDDNDKAHGYINVKSDDIQIPYEYTVTYLDNGDGEIISAETNVLRNTFKVYVDENGTYEVKITDGNGKTIRKNVVLSKPKITIEYDVVSLGTKFYNSEATERPYICDKESGLYGTITFTGLTVDGYDGTIINISDPMPYNSENDLYEFNVTATTEVHQLVTAHVKMRVAQSFEEGKTTKDCCCKYKPEPTDYNELDHFINYTTSLQFNIYIPSMFLIEVEQTGNGTCEHENISSSIANVENSMNFNTFLNDMPVRFMLGTVQDKVDNSKEELIIAQQSSFYHSNNEYSTPTSSWLSGWCGVHDEKTYRFNLDSNKTTEENEEVWSDFVDFTIFSTTYTKLKIDKFKLDSMFSVADSTYVTEASNSNYVYDSQGGKRPILTRLVAPYYQDTDKLTAKEYLYEDNDTCTVDTNFPNIVGKNYSGTTENIEFNPIYRDNKGVIGNYFAAFTNNGGYSSMTGIDESKPVMAIPNHAAVNAKGEIIKQIGKDLEGVVTDFEKAYKYDRAKPIMPHFRAMYVDRRFDYNLMVFAPIVGQSIKIGDDEITWRSGRISGATFNGIEMAYDENYNVVSADTVLDDEGVILKVTSSTTLEYSYDIPNESADTRTVFNYESDVLKKPYSASINGFDISGKFWSQRNNRISTGDWRSSIPYYPQVDVNMCNDWFNIDNYPTRRIIDIGNIPYMPSYEFNYTSCAYKGNSSINEKNELVYIIDEGESTDISIDFANGIEFVPANTDNKFYSNVQYSYNGNKFISGYINMRFKYRPFNSSDDTHDVYTSTPVIIGVKKETSGNTITKIKRLSGVSRNNVERYINDSVGCVTYGQRDSERPSGIEFNDEAPERVRELEGGNSPIFFYFKSGDDYITSDDTEFRNIIFDKHASFMFTESKVFTIMYKRCYVDNTGSYLNRYLTTYEFGDMYDARDIVLTPVNGSCGNDGCTGSYVIRSTSAVNTSGSVPGSGGQSTSVTTQGDTSAYTQVLEFEIDTRDANNCQIFNQGNSIGYSMVASPYQMPGMWGVLGQNAARTIDNSEVEVKFSEGNDFAVEKVKVRFTWPQDMGYLGDSTWSVAYCSIFAKTSSGFVYRIGDFKLSGSTRISGDKSPTTGLRINSI